MENDDEKEEKDDEMKMKRMKMKREREKGERRTMICNFDILPSFSIVID